MSSLRIKICGITAREDADAAIHSGADALGFNFYARSPRYVDETTAGAIVQSLPPFVEPVALFVNESFDSMTALVGRLPGILTVQYHGDRLAPCPAGPYRYVPAFSVSDVASLRHIRRFLDECRQNGRLPAAVLLDAHVAGQYGGTGQTAPWSLLADFPLEVPVILAGGLTPEN